MSCANKIQFSTSIPPSEHLKNIRTLAIGDVLLVQEHQLNLIDNKGNWKVSRTKLDSKGLEKLLKHSLVSNLSRFSDYNIIDLETFSTIFGDRLKSIKPERGMRIKGIDAILNLSFAISVVSQEGQFDKVRRFQRHAKRKMGKKWIITEDSSTDRIITESYQTKTATVFLKGEIVQVKEGNTKLISSFSEVSVVSLGSGLIPGSFSQSADKKILPVFRKDDRSKEEIIGTMPFAELKHQTIGTKPHGVPNISRRLVLHISNMILPKFAPHSVLVTRTIDSGGDEDAVNLLNKAKIQQAKERIEEIISSSENKTAENLYNLGICYEALGEPRIAIQLYDEALQLDEGNNNVIKAIGALQHNF